MGTALVRSSPGGVPGRVNVVGRKRRGRWSRSSEPPAGGSALEVAACGIRSTAPGRGSCTARSSTPWMRRDSHERRGDRSRPARAGDDDEPPVVTDTDADGRDDADDDRRDRPLAEDRCSGRVRRGRSGGRLARHRMHVPLAIVSLDQGVARRGRTTQTYRPGGRWASRVAGRQRSCSPHRPATRARPLERSPR